MNINTHPVWDKVSKYKKPLHLARLRLAALFVKLFNRDRFIGVTGSVGKTTTTLCCQHVLDQKYKTLATIPTLDPIFNIPITLLKMRPNIQKCILEMGIEYPGEMDFYLSLVRPKTAVITKIGFAHSEFLGNVDEIINEKGKLLEALPRDGIAVLNADDVYIDKISKKTEANIVYFGTDPKTASVWADKIRIENFKTVFGLNYGVERVEVEFALLGSHQVYPALAAAALGVAEDISLVKIKKGLEKVTAADHRMQVINGVNNSIILDDTYNAAPMAVEAAIKTLQEVPARRRILVLGEMRELGKYAENLHREIAKLIYKEKIDLVLLGQGDAKFVSDELESLGFLEDRLADNLTNQQIVSYLLQTLTRGDVCLIKGARAIRLDEVVKKVIKK